MRQDDFLRRFRKAHGSKYDISKLEYPKVPTKVRIICPKHGDSK